MPFGEFRSLRRATRAHAALDGHPLAWGLLWICANIAYELLTVTNLHCSVDVALKYLYKPVVGFTEAGKNLLLVVL